MIGDVRHWNISGLPRQSVGLRHSGGLRSSVQVRQAPGDGFHGFQALSESGHAFPVAFEVPVRQVAKVSRWVA